MELSQEVENSETKRVKGFRDLIVPPSSWWYLVIVIPIIRLLLPLFRKRPWILPNHITFVSFFTACAACAFMLLGKPWCLLIAGFLVYFSYVLDCIDGMVARMNNTTSPWGAFLDKFLDGWKIPFYTLGIMWISLTLHHDILTAMLAVCYLGSAGVNVFMNEALPGIIKGSRWSESSVGGSVKGSGLLGRWMAFADRVGIRPTAGDIEADMCAYCIGPIAVYFFGWDSLKIFLVVSIVIRLVPLQMGHFYFAWRNLRGAGKPEMRSAPKE